MTRAFTQLAPVLGLLLFASPAGLSAATGEAVVRETARAQAREQSPADQPSAGIEIPLDGDLSAPSDLGSLTARRAEKIMICHVPRGNSGNFHEIMVSSHALDSHLAHGDVVGTCEGLCGENADCGFDPDLLPMPGTEFCYRGTSPIDFLGGGPTPDCDEDLGICTAVYPFCASLFNPVCDCDGNMYDNACTAQLMGANWVGLAIEVDDDGDGSIDFYSCD